MSIDKLLQLADQDWRDGALKRARDRYAEALRLDPKCWHAAFQLAWIDAAFGRLDATAASQLQVDGLSPDALRRLDMMASRPRPIAGSVEEWDIEALRAQGERKADWWETRGRQAQEAGLFGLADACYLEAIEVEPDHYFDPPPHVQRASVQASQHLAAIKTAVARAS